MNKINNEALQVMEKIEMDAEVPEYLIVIS
jgi:hypothetical protein